MALRNTNKAGTGSASAAGAVKLRPRINAGRSTPASGTATGLLESLPTGGQRVKDRRAEIFDFLRELSLFSPLPDSELRIFGGSCRFEIVPARVCLSSEGDEGNAVGFIVVSGRIALMKTSVNGKELVVELLPRGDCLGLILGLQKLTAQLSARAQVRSRVLWVPYQNLIQLISAHPGLYPAIVEHLLECLQSSYRISRGLAHDRVEVRIAAVIASLAIKYTKSLLGDRPPIIEITRQQIADLTGTTSETAIRVTRSFQSEGWIDIGQPGVLKVVNLLALQALAET